MSERPRSYTNESIERRSPELDVSIGEHTLKLTWYTTMVQAYKYPYQAMTHLEHTPEPGKTMFIFTPDGGDDKNLTQLMGLGFTTRLDAEPDDKVVDLYSEYAGELMVMEVSEHLEGGER